jgi:hypothetical protein
MRLRADLDLSSEASDGIRSRTNPACFEDAISRADDTASASDNGLSVAQDGDEY